MLEVPCVQEWNSGIWLLAGWLHQTCRSQGSRGTGHHMPSSHRGVREPGMAHVLAGILVKQEEVILDCSCKCRSGKLLKSFCLHKGTLVIIWQYPIFRGFSLVNICPPVSSLANFLCSPLQPKHFWRIRGCHFQAITLAAEDPLTELLEPFLPSNLRCKLTQQECPQYSLKVGYNLYCLGVQTRAAFLLTGVREHRSGGAAEFPWKVGVSETICWLGNQKVVWLTLLKGNDFWSY